MHYYHMVGGHISTRGKTCIKVYPVHTTYSDCTPKTAVSTACLVKVLCWHFARELRMV